jgi:NAD+ synthase (glutamine-hydrolysing)
VRKGGRLRGIAGEARSVGVVSPRASTSSSGDYDGTRVLGYPEIYERFFAFAQFERSAMPNGSEVTAGGSLSPRGDWRTPSDGSAAAWLRGLERDWD